MMSYFSILIPVYNQVGKMDRCMESLKKQGFADYEIVMVDDGSTDGSYEMIERFAEADDRIRIVRHDKNSSLTAARYTGMKEATGEVIIFLDSDDYLSDDALEVLYKAFKDKDADIIRFGYIKEPSGEEVVAPEVDDVLQALSEAVIFPAIWKNAYKKSVIDELLAHTKAFYCNMGEDVYFSHILFSFGKKVDRIDNPLYHYRIDTGMSSLATERRFDPNKFRSAVQNVKIVSEHIHKFMDEYNPSHSKQARRNTDRMERIVVAEYLLGEKDYRHIVEYLEIVKEEGMDELYDYSCNETMKIKILADNGVDVGDVKF